MSMKKEYAYLIISGISFGLIAFGTRLFSDLGFSLYEIALLVLSFGAISMLPFAVKHRMWKRDLGFFVTYAAIEVFAAFSLFGSIVLGVPVAIAAFLLYTQPFYTVLISKISLNEKIGKYKIISLLIALVGMVILVQPFNLEANPVGILLALLSGIALSLWIIYGRKGVIRKIAPTAINFWRSLFAVIMLVVLYPLVSSFIKDPAITGFSSHSASNLLFFAIYAVYVWGFAIILTYKGLEKVPASDAGILLLLEPVSATLLAAIFLLEPLTINLVFGALFILLSNYLIISRNK